MLGHDPRSMEIFVEIHIQNDDYQKGVQHLVDSLAQKFVVSWFITIFFS